MKTRTLLFTAALFGTLFSNAQCTITPTCTVDPNQGFCTTPPVNGDLPNGQVGVAYNESIQISVGTSAGGGAVTINSITINSVVVPSGMTSNYNPTNGVMPGGSSGCVGITGTPTASGSSTVTVNVTASTNFGAQAQAITYNLTIGTANTTTLVADQFGLFPNPAENELTLTVNETSRINIMSLTGEVALSTDVTGTQTIDISALRSGIYFIVSEETGSAAKFIKQ